VILTPPGDVTLPYSQTFGVSGGTAPFTWVISSGNPSPWGLSLSSAGVLSGTPTAAVDGGVIAVRVTDATGAFADGEVDINIFRAPTYDPKFTRMFDATGFAETDAGLSIFADLGFRDGNAEFNIVGPGTTTTPPCLRIENSEGYAVTGYLDPTNAACVGTFHFGARLTDSNGAYADATPSLTLKVNPPLTLSPSPPPAGNLNRAGYSWSPTA
jgi:hypothetical protein